MEKFFLFQILCLGIYACRCALCFECFVGTGSAEGTVKAPDDGKKYFCSTTETRLKDDTSIITRALTLQSGCKYTNFEYALNANTTHYCCHEDFCNDHGLKASSSRINCHLCPSYLCKPSQEPLITRCLPGNICQKGLVVPSSEIRIQVKGCTGRCPYGLINKLSLDMDCCDTDLCNGEDLEGMLFGSENISNISNTTTTTTTTGQMITLVPSSTTTNVLTLVVPNSTMTIVPNITTMFGTDITVETTVSLNPTVSSKSGALPLVSCGQLIQLTISCVAFALLALEANLM